MNVYVKYKKWIKGKKCVLSKKLTSTPHKSVDQDDLIEVGYLHRP